MFQSSAKRLRSWWHRFDDLLADHPDETPTPQESFRTHPHRRPVRFERTRRAGAVAASPAHCISPVLAPVRSGTEAPTRQRTARL